MSDYIKRESYIKQKYRHIAFRNCDECKERHHPAAILSCELYHVCEYDPRRDLEIDAKIMEEDIPDE